MTSRYINIARNSHKAEQDAVVVCGGVLLLNSNTPLDCGRFCGCKQSGSFRDLFFFNPGNCFHPLQRILHGSFSEGLPAECEVLYKLPVVETFFDNNMSNTPSQGSVCSRAEL